MRGGGVGEADAHGEAPRPGCDARGGAAADTKVLCIRKLLGKWVDLNGPQKATCL